MRALGAWIGVAMVLALCGTLVAAEGPFQPLFDGKTLKGWSGDPRLWKVEDGAIVGSTDEVAIKHNTFLATIKSYKNFVLKVKFKLRNGNSGIQFRSTQHPDYVVKGYQADIADNQFMGILYDEGGGRGILAKVDPDAVAKHVRRDDWNEYVITCQDVTDPDTGRRCPHIKQVLNGFTTVDYVDNSGKGASEGIIALQLHVGPKMKVWFKDIRILELP